MSSREGIENVVTLQIAEQGLSVLWDRHRVPVD
jgi:hypothetical protein